MAKPAHLRLSDLRGFHRLASDAALGLTDLVEATHHTIARLGGIRSAGIKDLRQGNVRDEDWQRPPATGPRIAADPLPLPTGVPCYALAASEQERPNASGTRIRGDGLVPVNSALGRHRDASFDLGLPATRRWVGYGMGHFDLLNRREAYERIRRWLAVDSK